MEGSEAIRPDKYTEAGHTETGRYLGAFQRVERRGDTFVLRAERGGAAVLFPADGIFRIKFFWQGEPDLSSTVAIDPAFRQKSESGIGLEETGDRVILRTSLIALEIDKPTFAFTVRDKEGKVLC